MRRTKKGKFKGREIVGTAEKKAWAEDYYDKHRKQIDSAVNQWKEDNGVSTSKSNKEIFASEIAYGTVGDFHSVKKAQDAVSKKLHEMRGGDIELWEAKHDGAYRAEAGFNDLRKLNGKVKTFVDYDFENADLDVNGYFDIEGTDYVIAKVWHKSDSGSPYFIWEYTKKGAIGL